MSGARTSSLDELITEAQRVLSICNACRYCEGYCAVFPALQRRLAFDEGDVHYLANLCHNCGSCLYACQYAPPHAFQLNFPRLLAVTRKASYGKFAWPARAAASFEFNGRVVALVATLGILALLLVALGVGDSGTLLRAYPDSEGSFYRVLPHKWMAAIFGVALALPMVVMIAAVMRFWSATGERQRDLLNPHAMGGAALDAATLRYLAGADEGCRYPDEKPSRARRNFHHLAAYGFLLCFAATIVGTIYHYAFGWHAPYALGSLPVLLGTSGGIGLLIGPAGLFWLRRRRDPDLVDVTQSSMDLGFLLLLATTSATGLLLLALRESAAMGALLIVHLGLVLALFLTLPYGKFVHAFFRFAALVRFHLERRRPAPQLGAE